MSSLLLSEYINAVKEKYLEFLSSPNKGAKLDYSALVNTLNKYFKDINLERIIFREKFDPGFFNIGLEYDSLEKLELVHPDSLTLFATLKFKESTIFNSLILFSYPVTKPVKSLIYSHKLRKFCLAESMNNKHIESQYSINKFSWTVLTDTIPPSFLYELGFEYSADMKTFSEIARVAISSLDLPLSNTY
jgi:hypothetical protein